MIFNSSNISKYIKAKKSSYKIFNIKYNKKEKDVINKITINCNSNFVFHGNFNEKTLIKGQCGFEGKSRTHIGNYNIFDFLLKNGNDKENIEPMIKLIYKIANKFVKGYNNKHISIQLRTMLPNNQYKKPNWHKDTGFIDKCKFVTALKGPGTLIIKDTDTKSRDTFFNIVDKADKDKKKFLHKNINAFEKISCKYRNILAKELIDADFEQITNDQGLIFFTDDVDNKNIGIHSEPNINQERFFISIMCSDYYL
jgi:hypothetical protein